MGYACLRRLTISRHGQQRAGDVEDGGADAAGLRQLGALGVDNDGLLGEQAEQTVALFLAELLVDGDRRIRALDKAVGRFGFYQRVDAGLETADDNGGGGVFRGDDGGLLRVVDPAVKRPGMAAAVELGILAV